MVLKIEYFYISWHRVSTYFRYYYCAFLPAQGWILSALAVVPASNGIDRTSVRRFLCTGHDLQEKL